MQQAIVSALYKIGPMLKQELIGMTKAKQSDVNAALRNGFIVHAEEYGEVTYAVSKKGCRTYGFSLSKSRIATARSYTTSEPYDGSDLKQFNGRPGCNDAMALPSRQLDKLFYRNGRVEKL